LNVLQVAKSSSLSDSLCRTDSARIYSSGIYVDVKTAHVSQALTGCDVGITRKDRDHCVARDEEIWWRAQERLVSGRS